MASTGVRLSLAVAADRNGVIGADGDLAWRISDDLKWFKANTLGKPVAMGRKTFQSIGRPLPGRDNIVVTRAGDFSAPGAFVTHSIAEALRLARVCAERRGAEEVCVIGGAEIYAQTIAEADRIYLTRVDAAVAGDVFFPEIDSRQWRETPCGGCEKNSRNEHACEFVILDRYQ